MSLKKRYCPTCQTGYYVERGVELLNCPKDNARIVLLGREMVKISGIQTVRNIEGKPILV